MSTFKKNAAVTGFPFLLVSATDGSAITTGTPTIKYLLNGGTQGTVTDAATHEGGGQWSFDLTAAEMNGDTVGILITLTGAIPVHFTLKTETKLVSDLNDFDATADDVAVVTSVTNGVVVTTNNDKAGYSITALPAITANWITAAGINAGALDGKGDWNIGKTGYSLSGGVTVTTNNDKTGYTVSTVSDKTGYSISGAISTLDGLNDISPAEVNTQVDLALSDYDGPTKAELDSGLAGLNDITTAQVNAEMVDVLETDTHAEPGQGAPAATASLKDKIGYLYKTLRNKKEATATSIKVYNDAGTVVDQKRTISDDDTTYTEEEIVTGP